MKKIVILLFLSQQIFAQSITLKGKLVDKETNEPVVFANISFLNSNIGISSLENGTFLLEIKKNQLNEKVHISCLNYKDTVVFANELQNKIFFLNSKNIVLDEVVISRKVDRELVIDAYKKKELNSGYGALKKNPWIVTKFFKYNNIYKKTPYLKEVTFYIGKFPKAKSGKFRVRFFSIDSLTDKPKDDIIQNQIIVSVKKRNKKVTVDLSKYDIEFPKEGFFIGFEFLYIPSNFYDFKVSDTISKKNRKIKTFISPSLRGIIKKNKITWVFFQGKWRKSNFSHSKNETIIPAISVTLSN